MSIQDKTILGITSGQKIKEVEDLLWMSLDSKYLVMREWGAIVSTA